MDERRKNAYRHLLYWAMLEIRPIAWRTSSWWNPFSTNRALRQVGRAGSLADAMHNLAFFSAHDFERFDEEHFWRDMEFITQEFPDFCVDHYRNQFDSFLADNKNETA